MTSHQFNLDLKPAGRGGVRPGAGRPKGRNPEVLHRQREKIPGYCPVHVTVKVKSDVPRLRSRRFLNVLRQALVLCCRRPGFRLVHYTVQNNHFHFVIEAKGKVALANGMKSVNARIARAINRVFGRSGKVLHGRFHSHVCRTPREVRNVLAYVLLNHRHHARKAAPVGQIDTASSGFWFDGWRDRVPNAPNLTRDVAEAGTWLLTKGWRKHRLIRLSEVPG